jgi:vanillate O-demethylase ferredoxin subunit
MLQDFWTAAERCGITSDRLHFEYFKSEVESAKDGGFTVVLRRSGKELSIAPGQSILEAFKLSGQTCPIPAWRASADRARPV